MIKGKIYALLPFGRNLEPDTPAVIWVFLPDDQPPFDQIVHQLRGRWRFQTDMVGHFIKRAATSSVDESLAAEFGKGELWVTLGAEFLADHPHHKGDDIEDLVSGGIYGRCHIISFLKLIQKRNISLKRRVVKHI